MMYNERKAEILEFVEDYGPVTSNEVADYCGVEIHDARVLLKQYHKNGLLYRRKVKGNRFGLREYTITDRGSSKLEYLKSRF